MQKRALLMLSVAILMGVVAVYLVNTRIQQPVPQAAVAKPIDTQPVVVAASDLDVGQRLSGVALRVVEWPSESIPKGAYPDTASLLGEDKPPVVLKEIRAGEPILPYELSPQGARAGLTLKIDPSKRAITIPVNEVQGVAGFVLPGDRVDVLHTTTAGRIRDDLVTRVLLQNVLVLGVDQESSEKEDQPRVVNAVTILVDPKQAQKVTLAQSVGHLNLALRNETDNDVAMTDAIELADLISGDDATPTRRVVRSSAPKRPSTDTSVQIIKGLNIESERVKKYNGPNPASSKKPEQSADLSARHVETRTLID